MIRRLLAAVVVFVAVRPCVAEDLRVLPSEIDGVAPKHTMHAYLMREVREALERRRVEYEKLQTPDQLAAYQERMREYFVSALGGFPERTPLRPQIVAREDRGAYRVEKLIFESQPHHFVTALLYLPKTEPPYPGVLVPCGHSHNGKASGAYQLVCILLARSGMAALCYDPIDQGERYQLLDEEGQPLAGGTTAHCLVGVGSTLLGRNTATYRVWDGMRAIDYLQSREEVDAARIGCTGNSGGGTLTSYLMALDERIESAAPSCYLTTFRRLCETIGPQDAEQNIFGQIAFGMDHADYVMMRGPKPTLICAATHDFFDIDGTWDTFRQAKRFYTRLGYAERVGLIETDAKHGFSGQLRVGAVRWMRRWLMHKDDAITEPESEVAADEQVQCTPRGQVMLLPEARSTYDINLDLAKELAEQRERLWREGNKRRALDEVRRITKIRKLDELPQPAGRVAGAIEREGYRVEKLILEPDPGIRLPALGFVPPKPSGDAHLYLHDQGKHAHAAPGGPIETLVRQGHVVLAVDVRGLGETAGEESGKRGISHHIGGDWKDLYLAYLLGRSYVAMRAEDILVCARFLAGYESTEKPSRVHLHSIGRVGPAALHAVALEPQLFESATLVGCLRSWADVLRTPLAVRQFENVVHGGLRIYDLPDLLAALPKAKVTSADPVDALGRPLRK